VQNQRHKLQETAGRSREGLQKYISTSARKSVYIPVRGQGREVRQEKGRSQGQVLREKRRKLAWVIEKARESSDDTRTDGHNQERMLLFYTRQSVVLVIRKMSTYNNLENEEPRHQTKFYPSSLWNSFKLRK